MERTLSTGGATFTITARQEGREWIAEARREGRRDNHGPVFRAETPEAALDRCAAWLGWQQEHEAALVALQEAERVYQRAVAAGAFAPPGDGPGPEVASEALQDMEAARVRLEEIRRRQPAA
ncbi:MAG: hypothetical protein KGN76_15365 [Acidobacteriota bacterium]|nr:hypothetical protein [Acidobacteriota bacterium]